MPRSWQKRIDALFEKRDEFGLTKREERELHAMVEEGRVADIAMLKSHIAVARHALNSKVLRHAADAAKLARDAHVQSAKATLV